MLTKPTLQRTPFWAAWWPWRQFPGGDDDYYYDDDDDAASAAYDDDDDEDDDDDDDDDVDNDDEDDDDDDDEDKADEDDDNKGLFINDVIFFRGGLDPTSPPRHAKSLFGLPPLPPS